MDAWTIGLTNGRLDLLLCIQPLSKHSAPPMLRLHPERRRRAPHALLAPDAGELVDEYRPTGVSKT